MTKRPNSCGRQERPVGGGDTAPEEGIQVRQGSRDPEDGIRTLDLILGAIGSH